MDSLQGVFNGLAGLAIVLGLVYCFTGYRIRQFILAVPGYIAGAAILGAVGYLLSQQMWVAVLVGIFAGGPIGASIVLALYNVKVFAIGLLLGGVIDVALYLLTDGQIAPAVLLIIPIVTGILALIHDKWVIVAGTAFGGAALAVGGIAWFTSGGVGAGAIAALLASDPSLLAATLGGWLVLGVAGVIVQYQTLKPQDRAEWWSGSNGGSAQGSNHSGRPALSADGQSPRQPPPEPQPPKFRPQAFTGHTSAVSSIIWDPNGRWLATAGDYGDVYVWDAQSGSPLLQLWGSRKALYGTTSLEVSLDGSWLAANSLRGERSVWDTATGRLLAGPDSMTADNRYALCVRLPSIPTDVGCSQPASTALSDAGTCHVYPANPSATAPWRPCPMTTGLFGPILTVLNVAGCSTVAAPAPSAGSAGTHPYRAGTAGRISRWIRIPLRRRVLS